VTGSTKTDPRANAPLNEEEMDEQELESQEFGDDANKDRYMTFRIGDQNYGVEILHVTEIVGLQDIAEVPDVPGYVKGMINLRGNVIPVIDVRKRFGMSEREYDDRTCVVVVTVDSATVGMIVDRVNEVAVFGDQNISPPPQRSENAPGSEYINGLGKNGENVTILLDTTQLIYSDRLQV